MDLNIGSYSHTLEKLVPTGSLTLITMGHHDQALKNSHYWWRQTHNFMTCLWRSVTGPSGAKMRRIVTTPLLHPALRDRNAEVYVLQSLLSTKSSQLCKSSGFVCPAPLIPLACQSPSAIRMMEARCKEQLMGFLLEGPYLARESAGSSLLSVWSCLPSHSIQHAPFGNSQTFCGFPSLQYSFLSNSVCF